MYASFFYMFWKFGLTSMLNLITSLIPESLRSFMEERDLSETEIQCLDKIKEYLVKNSNLSEYEAIGFIAFENIPIMIKKHPQWQSLSPEELLDHVDDHLSLHVKVEDSE